MAERDSPLIKALPPETDFISYLTIVEQYLTEETLPILHKVLQDEAITTNIGWDLVHLLVPYLPASEQCLQDIARLGNPREVILKVTESLRLIDYTGLEEGEDEDEAKAGADAPNHRLKTAVTEEGKSRPGSSQAVELPPPLPLPVSQFVALLSMLAILQARIKTKYPSRFLSTALQAILASFSDSTSHREKMIISIVKTVKAVSGIHRPALPARRSSGMLSSISAAQPKPAPDPEAATSEDSSAEESGIQTKLLQSFVSHVFEEYLLNLPSDDDVPGVAWCSRLMEKLHPERIIPQTITLAERFAIEEKLQGRLDAIGQLVTLSKDLKLSDEELLAAAITEEAVPEKIGDEDDPPASAAEIPLPRMGSCLLYTARQASAMLYDSPKKSSIPFAIFPDHHELLKNCVSSPSQGTGSLGTEPESLIDAVDALGLICLERDAIGEPATDEQFSEYLQVTALLSSNCPNPNLRGHAHYLTTTVLRAQPDDNARLAFIRDTLEHCPFENLKVSAVGWIKGETIEANPPTLMPRHHHGPESSAESDVSIFATPLALDSLAPYLFPSLQADLVTAPVTESWRFFQANLSFYLASLNFIYLLLSARHLHQNLDIADMWRNNDIAGSFLQSLREASARYKKEMNGGGDLAGERSDELEAELNVLDESLERVTAAFRFLNGT